MATVSTRTARLRAAGGTLLILLAVAALPARAQEVEARSTSGPQRPAGVSLGASAAAVTGQVLLPGVPIYLWHNGCGPTAAGMVVGYWDGRGFDDLVPGGAATETADVDSAIASAEHYNDYALPLDQSPGPLEPDKSEPPVGDEHPDNCLADYFRTSQSYYRNYYGYGLLRDMRPGLIAYCLSRNPAYSVESAQLRFGVDLTWDSLRAEIDAGRPLIFLVDTDGDRITDHFVPVVGYGYQGSARMYACYDTWDTDLHWYEFRGLKRGSQWGVYGAVTLDFGLLSAVWGIDDPLAGNPSVQLAPSSDGGATFDPARALSFPQSPSPRNLRLALGPRGQTYFAWALTFATTGEPQPNIFFVRSSDGGATLTDAVALVNTAEMVADCDVAAGGPGEAYVLWVTGDPNSSQNASLMLSTDGGATFSAPQAVPLSSDQYRASLAAAPGWRVYVAAPSTAGTVSLLRSDDAGSTYATTVVASGLTDADCDVAAVGAGEVYVVYETSDAVAGTSSAWICHSTDSGATFGAAHAVPLPLQSGHGGLRVAAAAGGRVEVAVGQPESAVTGSDTPAVVQVVHSADGGQTFSAPETLATGTVQTLSSCDLAAPPPAGGPTLRDFSDVPPDFWAYDEIQACFTSGVVGGYPDGTYHPEYTVTRDQMAAFIARALAGGDDLVPTGPAAPDFPDVPLGNWAYKYVEYAKSKNIVAGEPDGDYHPADPVDRAQMAVFIARSIVDPTGDGGLTSYRPPVKPSFADVPSDFWAYEYVEYLAQRGVAIVQGYADGLYHPEYIVTRDQMAVFVARAFNLLPRG